MFKKVNPKQDFFQLEQEVLKFWKEKEILNKSIEQRSEENQFTFYDGPITANGEAHVGHMLTFSIKDIIPRYKTMKGFRVPRSLGWDCHGIPVEYEIEKKLGFKEKKDIENYGIAEFNKLCKESVEKYRNNIIELEELIGRLTNSDEEYATMDKNFIESVWWSLKELYEKGFLYEGFKVVPYSTRAGTTLSNAEVALGGYKTIVDPAITVKFALKSNPNTKVLAWTTTPWTIPSNLGLAVGKEIEYSVVKTSDSEEEFIVATALVESVFEGKDYEIIKSISADELIGQEYIPPFDFFVGNKNAHIIYDGFHVTTDSGTGIVHLAPYGEEDNQIFQEVGIDSFDVLDEQGDFTNVIEPYFGQNYREANTNIVNDLRESNTLFKHEDYSHEMPMCWRTKTPLIYKPINSWFVGMSSLRNELVENNNKVNWVPDHVKEGRFGHWLAEIKDWAISRKRYWGTPLPVWRSESGKIILIGSYKELEELSGQKVDDPHRPFIDDITFEKDGETYTRVTDVIDVWYDSGSMPFARLHYPFENKDKFENKFPAEYIAEGIDQTRGWFYSLHALGTALFNNNAYNNVVINGTIVDAQKRKLSKSLGNYTAPLPTIQKFGADTVRMNFFSTPLMYGEDTTVDDKTLKETKQEAIIPLWNILSYFITYANIHNWEARDELAYNNRINNEDDTPWDHIPFDNLDNEADAWIITLLQKTIKEVNEQMDSYAIPKASNAIRNFVSELSKWYIRTNRDRFINGETRVLDVLYYCLVEVSKLLAPFAPFISEFIYQELVVNSLENQKESVHLTDYPVADEKFIEQNEFILSEMDVVRRICEFGHNLRVENKLKVRQPLNSLAIKLTNAKLGAVSQWVKNLLMTELNVKDVFETISLEESDNLKITGDESSGILIGLDIHITDELKAEGLLRELTRYIQSERKTQRLNLDDTIEVVINIDNNIKEILEVSLDKLKKQVNATNISFADKKQDILANIDGTEFSMSVTKN